MCEQSFEPFDSRCQRSARYTYTQLNPSPHQPDHAHALLLHNFCPMTGPMINPPKSPTDNLYLETFKTLSRLQLVVQFRPWLEYTRDYVFRRADSPYFLFWDCILFGAPLNTLLELLGSHTPRHLVVTPDEFDFTLSAEERTPFFVSFIQRVQALESHRDIPFGEVLKLEDFTGSQNASFLRVRKTCFSLLPRSITYLQ